MRSFAQRQWRRRVRFVLAALGIVIGAFSPSRNVLWHDVCQSPGQSNVQFAMLQQKYTVTDIPPQSANAFVALLALDDDGLVRTRWRVGVVFPRWVLCSAGFNTRDRKNFSLEQEHW